MKDQLIQSHPNIMMGKPVVAGTRITVELILEKLGAGETIALKQTCDSCGHRICGASRSSYLTNNFINF